MFWRLLREAVLAIKAAIIWDRNPWVRLVAVLSILLITLLLILVPVLVIASRMA